jgi:hypothetical protein
MSKRRKNAKQLRVTDAIADNGQELLHRYALAYNKYPSWNEFGNMLIEHGIKAMGQEIEQALQDDRDCLV